MAQLDWEKHKQRELKVKRGTRSVSNELYQKGPTKKQLKILFRMGLDCRQVSRRAACEIIEECKQNNWTPTDEAFKAFGIQRLTREERKKLYETPLPKTKVWWSEPSEWDAEPWWLGEDELPGEETALE